MSGTEGGRLILDQSFASRLLTYGVLPLAPVVAAQVPQVGRFLGELLRFAR